MSVKSSAAGRPFGWPAARLTGKAFHVAKVRRNIRMVSQAKRHLVRVLTLLPAVIIVLFMFSTLAAAQDQPAPKWELFGGYTAWDPGANVHGQLPGALLPLSSRLEWNPRGIGGSATYDFNRWFGLTLDASTAWGSGETGLPNRIDD